MNDKQSLLEAALEARKRFESEANKNTVEIKEDVSADTRLEEERQRGDLTPPDLSRKSATFRDRANDYIQY